MGKGERKLRPKRAAERERRTYGKKWKREKRQVGSLLKSSAEREKENAGLTPFRGLEKGCPL